MAEFIDRYIRVKQLREMLNNLDNEQGDFSSKDVANTLRKIMEE